jgi:cell wall-associated NlpC family hydrolase
MLRKSLYLGVLAFSVGCSSLPPQPSDVAIDTSPMSEARQEAMLQTLLALGIDYRYGGKSHERGFDCSGLVAHVFREAYGIDLPHNAYAQSRLGVRVSLSELRAGDLVFYNTLNRPFSHVGIYLGDGRFVHAPKTGAQVRVESMRGRYWLRRFDGARRIGPARL